MSESATVTGSRMRSLRLGPLPNRPASGVPAVSAAAGCGHAVVPRGHPTKPRLLDQLREAIRTRHYSYRTEEAYVGWIRRFVLFHGKRHPAEMGPPEITQFLTALAVDRHVSASTQNQALAAVLFLYQQVLGCTPGWLDDIVRAKRAERLPVVLTRTEVQTPARRA